MKSAQHEIHTEHRWRVRVQSSDGVVMDAKVEKGVRVVVDCVVRWGAVETGNYVLSEVL